MHIAALPLRPDKERVEALYVANSAGPSLGSSGCRNRCWWRKVRSSPSFSPFERRRAYLTLFRRLWVHGGEYSAPNQSSFYHYRDLWSFDLTVRSRSSPQILVTDLFHL